ncbi:antitoxin [Sphingobium sp. CR28]|uniref:antitoxin n=1 Tax=Sphingobium sp. CR28 TaxID=3400272 RepID=UPI003FF00E1E
MSRLTIDISDQQHQSLKAMAALQGKSIKQYAIERLFPNDGEQDQAWNDLKALVARRVGESLEGALSEKSFDTIVEEELGQDGKA